jgi:hypothetical protein
MWCGGWPPKALAGDDEPNPYLVSVDGLDMHDRAGAVVHGPEAHHGVHVAAPARVGQELGVQPVLLEGVAEIVVGDIHIPPPGQKRHGLGRIAHDDEARVGPVRVRHVAREEQAGVTAVGAREGVDDPGNAGVEVSEIRVRVDVHRQLVPCGRGQGVRSGERVCGRCVRVLDQPGAPLLRVWRIVCVHWRSAAHLY